MQVIYSDSESCLKILTQLLFEYFLMIKLNTSFITLLFDILYTREISSRIFTNKILFTIMSSMTFNTKL